jgi:hypothetical protein
MRAATNAIDLTSFGSAINLLNTYTKGANILGLRIVTTGGTITVKTSGCEGVARTLTVAEGEFLELEVVSIDSVAGPVRIRVYW